MKSTNQIAKEIKDMQDKIKYYLSEIKLWTSIRK